ncbi:MAG: S-methyl-5-thioribose kinase [Pontibacterium sp.]
MSAHKFSNDAEIIAFVHQHTDLVGEVADFNVSEIGDGNINFIYRVANTQGQSVIVKQALPYVRIIGEGWPLSLDRVRIEAEALAIEGQYAPAYVPKLFHFDAPRSAIIMEDVGDHENLRLALTERRALPNVAKQLAEFLANTLFYTSDMALDAYDRKKNLGSFINPDLCKITEDLFFLDPYCDHERNSYNPLLVDDVHSLWGDEALKAEVAELKYRFLNNAQALLHGDLHSGSVFVRSDSTKVIDPEFAFYGPIGFDVGSVIGNLLLNYCAQFEQAGAEEERAAYQAFLLSAVKTLWHEFAQTFSLLLIEHTQDESLRTELWQQKLLRNILSDSLGYAGTEMIRRTIGLAHVFDLDSIEDEVCRARAEHKAVRLGRRLIMQREVIASKSVLTIDEAVDSLVV